MSSNNPNIEKVLDELAGSGIENDISLPVWIYKAENLVVNDKRYLKIYLVIREAQAQPLSSVQFEFENNLLEANKFQCVSEYADENILGTVVEIPMNHCGTEVAIKSCLFGDKAFEVNKVTTEQDAESIKPEPKKSTGKVKIIAIICAVVIVLGAIAIIAVPKINKTNSNTKQEADVINDNNDDVVENISLYKVKAKTQINVREQASTKGAILGVIDSDGKEYDVYEEVSSEGYIWRRIGDSEWIADDGTWLEIVNQINQKDEPNDNVPTTDEVIALAEKHASWIDSWFKKNKDAEDLGWNCMGPTTESASGYIETIDASGYHTDEIVIPKGSFTGGRGAAGGTSGWEMYRFAYVKTDNGYEFIDLFRQDQIDDYYDNIEKESLNSCSGIINKVFTNPSEVHYLTVDDGNWADFDYEKTGSRHRYYIDNYNGQINIFPAIGYAYIEEWNGSDWIPHVLMENNQVVDVVDNNDMGLKLQ